jgi:hypothetical protein
MEVPHYTYLLLKILTKTGVLSLRANVHVAHVCEKEGFNLSDMMDMSVRAAEVQEQVKWLAVEDTEIPDKGAPRKAANSKDLKEIELIPGDSSKTTQIGTGLTGK